MELPHNIKILSVTSNVSLFACFLFVIFAAIYFSIYFIHEKPGDMGRGFDRLAYTGALFFIACGFMVISSITRFLLLRAAPQYRTRSQYLVFIVTAILSVIIVVTSIVGIIGMLDNML